MSDGDNGPVIVVVDPTKDPDWLGAVLAETRGKGRDVLVVDAVAVPATSCDLYATADKMSAAMEALAAPPFSASPPLLQHRSTASSVLPARRHIGKREIDAVPIDEDELERERMRQLGVPESLLTPRKENLP